jgi:HD-GYP domain-containing protein (c-di-GMP phosphodiesterase class II)
MNEAKIQELRMDLLNKINTGISSATGLSVLVEQIMQMAQSTLLASASSVMLLDEEKQELYFEVAQGDAKNSLKQVRISTQSGVAGWVVNNRKPCIVNDVNKDQRFFKSVDKTTGFVTKSILCVPLIVHAKAIGVLEILNKNDGSDFKESDLEAIAPAASVAALAIENTNLREAVTIGYKSTLKALAASIDAKDPYTRGHSQRVMEYALIGARVLSLPQTELETIEYGGILHDTGKIGIPEGILGKPGCLTSEEWAIMRQHPLIGANIIKDVSFLCEAVPLVLNHHERYDGAGYPNGTVTKDIPIGARLITVADSYDAMTSDRPYRPALKIEQAIAELGKNAGKQFCPIAVEAFITGLRAKNTKTT